MIWKFIISRS